MTEAQILQKLKDSNLTPAKYNPSKEFLEGDHICVFANGNPMVLTGIVYKDDMEVTEQSIREAKALAKLKPEGRPTFIGYVAGELK